MQFVLFASLLLAAKVSASPLSGNQVSLNRDNITYVNVTLSPFERIMNLRLTTPDPVYSTPAVMFVGTSEHLLRCLHDDPDQCEIFFNTGTYVYSLHISGEHIYCGLYSGVILRCSLDQKECVDFQKGGSSVRSLTSAGGHLYVGLTNNTISRCELNVPNSCQPLHELENSVYSLLKFEEYIYAGLAYGQLMRCSLRLKNSCITLIKTMDDSSHIMGLSNIGNRIFAATSNKRMWTCTKNRYMFNVCEFVPLNFSYPQDLAAFMGELYTLGEYETVYNCKFTTSSPECSDYVKITDVYTYSMTFAYGTYKIQHRYKNEDTKCSWQSKGNCPPGVTYYNAQQRALLEVHVKDGRLYNSAGVLVDTSNADQGMSGPAANFAMGPDGRLLLSNSHKKELLHTSSLLAGSPVSGAGEITVTNGVIQKMRACSAHYQTDTDLNGQVVQSLRAQGYTEHIDSVMCNESENGDFGQMESNDQ